MTAGATDRGRARLERSLGFKEALTIGAGTMIGAGIFVFPGLAAGRAGAAAAASFALGGVIALLVALPTSELASAMPRSGGGYHFVSRSLGPFAGTLVGLGQWLGLVFASAFYLAGFGFYAADVAARLGLAGSLPSHWAALAAAVTLTAVGILGTRTSGRLQDWVVAVLVLLLVVFLGWGLVQVTGVVGRPSLPSELAPMGILPIFGTAALVFTSYLGFEQIASVAGEVRDPGRTLPRSMVASVVGVAVLYVLTILVATSVATPEELAAAGETALTLVGRELLGATGALLVAVAGLLATVSSANASILSASRAVFALSRDRVMPDAVSRVSHRFRTPHAALVLTGLPIALLSLLGRIEVLAESASVLFLFMFGLTCLGFLVLRRRDPAWYRPTFRLRGALPIALLGATASFGLLAFMEPLALASGAVVLAAAAVWHLFRARRVELRVEPGVGPALGPAGGLLLVTSVPDSPELPEALLEAFRGRHVVLLGWCEVPEQATPDQVEEELGKEAARQLGRLADRLREEGIDVDMELAYGGRLVETLERAAVERGSGAALVLRPIGAIQRVLVHAPRADMADTLARYTASVTGPLTADVHLLLRPDEIVEETRTELRHRFERAGVELQSLYVHEHDADRSRAVLEACERCDMVILAETPADDTDELFGDLSRQVVQRAEVPVLIVRRPGSRA